MSTHSTSGPTVNTNSWFYFGTPTNLPEWVCVGCNVRVRQGQWKHGNSPVWKEKGRVVRMVEDTCLTALNRVGLVMYRVIVEWSGDETASLLPTMLEPYPSSGELETKG